MKYSDYYFSPNTRTLSTIIGVLFGAPSAIFMGWEKALIVGAAVAILASFILPFMVYRADLPYAKIKATLQKPFLFDERVRFTVAGGSVTGFFILTEESMIFLSLDRGDHRLELSRKEVERVLLADRTSLSIFLGEKKFIKVNAATCDAMFRILRENGWNTYESNNENN